MISTTVPSGTTRQTSSISSLVTAMQLAKETVRVLEADKLQEVQGGLMMSNEWRCASAAAC